jgi:hypothetical protein
MAIRVKAKNNTIVLLFACLLFLFPLALHANAQRGWVILSPTL